LKVVTKEVRMSAPEERAAEQAQQRADELAAKADRMSDYASGMYGRFAGGQPLLVGHHSYRSAVRDRNRADNATRRAVEASKAAEQAQQKADRLKSQAELAAVAAARTRPWQRSDFQPGDIVVASVGPAGYKREDVGRVLRVNAKTLTIDGGGGGWNNPKRPYDCILSRTRNGVTITNPAEGEVAK
jgi:hypothetical protein